MYLRNSMWVRNSSVTTLPYWIVAYSHHEQNISMSDWRIFLKIIDRKIPNADWIKIEYLQRLQVSRDHDDRLCNFWFCDICRLLSRHCRVPSRWLESHATFFAIRWIWELEIFSGDFQLYNNFELLRIDN